MERKLSSRIDHAARVGKLSEPCKVCWEAEWTMQRGLASMQSGPCSEGWQSCRVDHAARVDKQSGPCSKGWQAEWTMQRGLTSRVNYATRVGKQSGPCSEGWQLEWTRECCTCIGMWKERMRGV